MKKMVFFPATLMLTVVISFVHRTNNSISEKQEMFSLHKIFASETSRVFNKGQSSLINKAASFPPITKISGEENYIPGVGRALLAVYQ